MMKIILISILVIVSLASIVNSYPIDDADDEENEYQSKEFDILIPPQHESTESNLYDEDKLLAEEDGFIEFVEPEDASHEKDPEEEQNDSGFHREPGHNRPDGARRTRRSAQDDDDNNDNDNKAEDEEYDWDWGTDDVEPGSEDNGDEGDDQEYETSEEFEDYEFPSYSDEEIIFDYEQDAIDNGDDFNDEQEVGEDQDGALLRLMHNSP